jgi:hypothetical protein
MRGRRVSSGGPFTLHRRSLLRGVLRGAAVSVALPPLEAMLNINGTTQSAVTLAGPGAVT